MSAERQEHNQVSPWWGEHVHRYQEALKYISQGSKVLDLACGSGFGSKLICEETKSYVVGGDISEESINYCTREFSKVKNLDFKVLDGTSISFDNGYFDAVVSFETIEHTTKYQEMVSEFNRVLKTGNYAIISTPNIIINSPTGKVLNPYHTQEFTYNELKNILEKVFDEVEIYGQNYVRYKTKSFKNTIGLFFEKMLYMRGVRKLPISLQNGIMNLLIGKDMYPAPDDFEMTLEKEKILKCKTFFAVCRKYR